ncbi:MAG: antibiotic biosynthesis monooxygenase [Neisseria sp.]|nr:antibiotic biosynthesis monooxygenase [Neisseria sp.]
MLKKAGLLLALALAALPVFAHDKAGEPENGSGKMMMRMAEIEIFPQYRAEYYAMLKEEAAASMRIEPGVLAIVPMAEQNAPAQIRLLEIYADQAAYDAHIRSPHFQHYKTGTAHMVKSLQLTDMQSLDAESLPLIFHKIKE